MNENTVRKHKKVTKELNGEAYDLLIALVNVSSEAKVYIKTPDGNKLIKSIQIIPGFAGEDGIILSCD